MKVKLPYTTTNDLEERIIRRMGAEMANTGKKVTKKDIIIDLAIFCNVSPENIVRIAKNYSQPSLQVAIKIAQYFNVSVEDIFKISKNYSQDT